MEIGKTLYVTERKEWRKWLEGHYKKEPDIWLLYYKKDSGKARIPYNDAVEEALCFGWIDSQVKSIDDKKYAQRYSPRKPHRPYSPINKERLRELLAAGKVMPEVAETLQDLDKGKADIPPDILKAIKADKDAWKHFQKFSPRYKRVRIGFIDGARKRPAEFKKRLNYFIKMTAQGKQFGFGSIEKYYKGD